MALDLNNCDKACLGCIKAYTKKHNLRKGEPFKIGCSGIPKEQIPLPILQSLPQTEQATARSLFDPVTWAAQTIDWHCLDPDGEIWKRRNPDEYYSWLEAHPGEDILGHSRYHRPYQAEMLSCTSKRKVFRIGRQCMTKDSIVYTPDGPLTADQVKEGQQLLGGKATFVSSHEDDVYRITFSNGNSITVNGEHPFYVTDVGWVKADNLSVKQKVEFTESSLYPEIDQTSISVGNKQAKLLGYLLSDGYWGPGQSVKFTNNNPDFIQEVALLSSSIFSSITPKIRTKGSGFDLHLTQKHGSSIHNPIDLYLKDLGVYDKSSLGLIKKFCNADLKAFLAGYFNGDGYLWHYERPDRPNQFRAEIGLAIGVSYQKALDMQFILWRLGITSYIKSEWIKKSRTPFYRILVSKRNSQLELLHFLDPTKYPGKFNDHQSILLKISNRRTEHRFSFVRSITLIGRDIVYGWETDTHEIISSCGMRTHNSGKTESLVISILFNMFSKPNIPEDEGFKAIVITPYQSQIDLIFGRLLQLIRSSPVLQNSLKRHVKAPTYTVELHNGSIVRGFSCVAGTKIVTRRGLINVENILKNDLVLSKNHKDLLEYLPVTQVFTPNFKQVYKVQLNSGHEVTVSDDHPFWTKNKQWKKLKDLKIGDKVATATDYKFDNESPTVDDLSYIIGLLLGDGTITEKTFKDGGARFLSKNPLIQKSFESSLQNLNIKYRCHVDKRTGSLGYTIYKRLNIPNSRVQDRPLNELTQALVSLGLIGTTSKNKFIPIKLLNSGASVRRGLLKGLFETDGYVQADGTAGFCSISKELAYGVRDLLNTFGIKSSVRIKKQANKIARINTEQRFIKSQFDLFTVTIASKQHSKKLTTIIDLSNKGIIYDRFLEVLKDILPETNDLFFSKIRSIQKLDKATTYDFSVGDGTNNFVANGIILHNTAGTKSGGNAEAVRGQHGHMLVFDEADYLSSGDMDAAMSIITNYPNATVWMSSTPSGKREKFFENCFSKRWKEFHFPSNVNPLWNSDLEASFREELTELGYVHEIEADFGEQEQGVFQNAYVQKAKKPYQYGSIPYSNMWTYTVGVDWNDTKNGTTINVLGFNPNNNTFYIVDRHRVSRDGWTQLSACMKIAEVNRMWKPRAIYVDAGYGATQLEILHKFGWDALGDPLRGPTHIDSRLREIVKSYNFGSKVQTRDLFTKQPIEKHAKPFLVEQAVRRFEAGDIVFPETDTALENQLLGYIIDHITPTGNPVYKAANEQAGDHDLDALMLSIVAFALEITPLGKPKHSSHIAFSGQFGERTDPWVFEGDTVIRSNNQHKKEEERDRTKPRMNRTQTVEQLTLFPSTDLPAAHTHNNYKPRAWRWDGFDHDKPAPKTRSLEEAGADARKRLGIHPRRSGRPRRRNIY